MDLRTDLAALRKQKGFSQREFAKRLSEHTNKTISYVTIGRWERGEVSIPQAYILPLADLLGVKLDMTEEESIATQPGKPRLNETGMHLLSEYGDFLRSKPQYVEPPEVFIMPFFLQTASAGTGQPLDDSSSEPIEVSDWLHHNASFAVRVSGDSMVPYAYDGNIAFVLRADDGGVVDEEEHGLFSVDGEGYIKQLITSGGRPILHSYNAHYDPIELDDREVTAFGRVVAVLDSIEQASYYAPTGL